MGMLLHRSGGSAGIHVCVRDGDKGRFEVGWAPTFARVVLADVFVDLVFEVVFAVFGVRSHACSCLLAVVGQMVGTHGVGWCVRAAFTAFTALGDAH